MISSLHLRNFQCHADLCLDLGPITVLVGANGAGKTAVLRALRWLVLNEYAGTAGSQIRWGEESCQVEVQIDGHVLLRRRGKDENLYVLDGQEFRAFGKGVPTSIQELLRLGAANFQQQHDPAFWLTLTSGQAASALNDIFNLSQIDAALSSVASEVRGSRSRVEVATERLAEARQHAQELAWVKEANKEWQRIETLQAQQEDMQMELERLRKLYEQLVQGKQVIGELKRAVRHGEQLLAVGEQLLELQTQLDKLYGLRGTEELIRDLEVDLQRKQELLGEWLQVCPLCQREETT